MSEPNKPDSLNPPEGYETGSAQPLVCTQLRRIATPTDGWLPRALPARERELPKSQKGLAILAVKRRNACSACR
jgi:hypothetical protein